MRKKLLLGSLLVLTLILLMPSIPAVQQKSIEEGVKQDLQEKLETITLDDLKIINGDDRIKHPILYIIVMLTIYLRYIKMYRIAFRWTIIPDFLNIIMDFLNIDGYYFKLLLFLFYLLRFELLESGKLDRVKHPILGLIVTMWMYFRLTRCQIFADTSYDITYEYDYDFEIHHPILFLRLLILFSSSES